MISIYADFQYILAICIWLLQLHDFLNVDQILIWRWCLAAYYVITMRAHVWGALPPSRLKYFNKAVNLQIYKKQCMWCAGAKLAVCTAHIEGHQARPRALLHALRHYALRAKIVLVDFN